MTLRRLVLAGFGLGAAGGAALCAVVLWSAFRQQDAVATLPVRRPRPLRIVPAGGDLLFPLEGVATLSLVDSFTAPRAGGRVHRAIDLMAPRGTPVRAVTDGRVVRVTTTGAGGLAVYQVDGPGRRGYYYAHLDGIAEGIAEGVTLARGDLIGRVGSTGNASVSAPHLHFAAWEVTDAAAPWSGRPLNPYDFWRVVPVEGPAG